MPAMIVSGLTANEAVAATAVVAALTFAASRDRSLIIDVTTARIDRTTRAIHRASGETLAKGPVIHASVAPAHPHAGSAPAIGFAGAARKQR
jgi:hypothetical protein